MCNPIVFLFECIFINRNSVSTGHAGSSGGHCLEDLPAAGEDGPLCSHCDHIITQEPLFTLSSPDILYPTMPYFTVITISLVIMCSMCPLETSLMFLVFKLCKTQRIKLYESIKNNYRELKKITCRDLFLKIHYAT